MLSLLFSLITTVSFASQPRTVEYVDLDRYVGTWYEFAKIPASFQKDCIANTTAVYSKNQDGTVSVENSCDKENGERNVAKGNARIEDKETNAKLTVTFVKILGRWIYTFGGDYWVIGLGADYQFAVVGHPDREYGWILSRSPALDAASLQEAQNILIENGYDTCKLITTIQKDGMEQEVPLCEI